MRISVKSDEFVDNFNKLDFSYNLYTATFEDYHKEHVQTYFKKIMDNGYLYEKTEEQDYCEKCNQFLSDRELEGICSVCGSTAKGDQCDNCLTTLNAKELKDKKCRQCGTSTILKENTHLYFALSKFQDKIQKYVDEHKKLWRFNAVNESAKYLNMGLIDRAATRQLTWGIDTKVKGFEDKKIYLMVSESYASIKSLRVVMFPLLLDIFSLFILTYSHEIIYLGNSILSPIAIIKAGYIIVWKGILSFP
jgi:methionyl-tRNA synthetase